VIKPGDVLEIPGKNPERTGSTATRFVVTKASLAYDLDVEYADGPDKGRKTSFLIEKSRAEGYVAGYMLQGDPSLAPTRFPSRLITKERLKK